MFDEREVEEVVSKAIETAIDGRVSDATNLLAERFPTVCGGTGGVRRHFNRVDAKRVVEAGSPDP
jgi:hypothetical protein